MDKTSEDILNLKIGKPQTKEMEATNLNEIEFLNPNSYIDYKERNLPHWHQENASYFVTFHLSDSIPKEKSDEIKSERMNWLKSHKKPYSENDKIDFYKLFSDKIENLLNAGHGSCCLADEKIAKIVGDSLKYFNLDRYVLDEWVVMPNHVHVIVKPLGINKLTEIIHSWKSFTAKEINKNLKKTGQVWMHESFDHIIRNEKSLFKIRQYINDNPLNANVRASQASNIKR